MTKKVNKITSHQVLVERAVLAAVANSRADKRRKMGMHVFACKYGNATGLSPDANLEHECIRIVRAAGPTHARRLLTWFVSVSTDIGHDRYPRFVPVQRDFNEMQEAA